MIVADPRIQRIHRTSST